MKKSTAVTKKGTSIFPFLVLVCFVLLYARVVKRLQLQKTRILTKDGEIIFAIVKCYFSYVMRRSHVLNNSNTTKNTVKYCAGKAVISIFMYRFYSVPSVHSL